MLELAAQAGIGLLAGLLGGLLGVGGSTIIVPGLIIYLSQTSSYSGSQQHLVQSAAMICNVFIAAPAVVAHRQAGAVMKSVVYRLIPAALIGIVLGVALTNSRWFACENGRYLALTLAGFLIYVAGYNVWRLVSKTSLTEQFDSGNTHLPSWKIIAVGLPMGFVAGLLGIGGGSLCVPAQQFLLRLPLRRAIANSAATIMCVAVIGAVYKNLTLTEHNISVIHSLRLAIMLIPTAILGSFLGGRLTHILPSRVLRVVFIVFLIVVAYLTYTANATPDSSRPDCKDQITPRKVEPLPAVAAGRKNHLAHKATMFHPRP